MELEDCYKIGFVLKPHGLKGEVTVALDAEVPNDFSSIESVFLDINGQMVPFFIDAVSMKGSKAFVKFEDVDTIEAATDISKRSIFLPKTARPESGKDEFYDDEIIDFDVQEETVGFLGKVIGIEQAGINKLLCIDHQGKEILVPVHSPFITSINKLKKEISVSLPEGFLDI